MSRRLVIDDFAGARIGGRLSIVERFLAEDARRTVPLFARLFLIRTVCAVRDRRDTRHADRAVALAQRSGAARPKGWIRFLARDLGIPHDLASDLSPAMATLRALRRAEATALMAEQDFHALTADPDINWDRARAHRLAVSAGNGRDEADRLRAALPADLVDGPLAPGPLADATARMAGPHARRAVAEVFGDVLRGRPVHSGPSPEDLHGAGLVLTAATGGRVRWTVTRLHHLIAGGPPDERTATAIRLVALYLAAAAEAEGYPAAAATFRGAAVATIP